MWELRDVRGGRSRGNRALTLSALAALIFIAFPVDHGRAASARVAALQVALRAKGLYPHPIDGIMGPWTRGGTVRFQRRRDLAVDGIAGRQTRRALGRRGRPSLGSRTIRFGQRGWDVAALQFLVSSRGFGPGGFDGIFGPRTDSAVRRYQAAAGLLVDGLAGPNTLGALRGRRVYASPGGPVRFFRPVSAPIGDGFGFVGGRRHSGLDFPAFMGAPVGASGVGVVAFAGWNSGGYGNLVVVRHRLGFETWYAHLSRISVSVGQSVTGGSRIGYVGSTGRSTGPHLHFEVRRFGTPINPVPRLLAAAAARRLGEAGRRLRCRPNADVFGGRDLDPPRARLGRCP
jgi:peptidoglycan hydrolase-like protein with peptidoglycan-binding domain